MRDHTMIEELLSAGALTGLDAVDEGRLGEEMSSHGACDECARLRRATLETAGRLAFALTPARVSARLEEATLTRARAQRSPMAADPEMDRAPAGRTTRAWGLGAVAAAIVLFFVGWLAGTHAADHGSTFPVDGRVAVFSGSPANLALVYRPGESGMYLIGGNLEQPAKGTTYALWLFHGDTPVGAGCFSPSSRGSVLRFVDASAQGVSAAAVTQESTSCPSAPTVAPMLTASL